MPPSTDYGTYFKPDQEVKVLVRLADKRVFDSNSIVRKLDGNTIRLELFGSGIAGAVSPSPGEEVSLTTWTGWSHCRCTGQLLERINGRSVLVRLTGNVVEKQTREYYRLDVDVAVDWHLPPNQVFSVVSIVWEVERERLVKGPPPVLRYSAGGFRVINWQGAEPIDSQSVNLSGGGLRFRTNRPFEPGELLYVDIFLPLTPPKIIHTVTEVVRCNEMLLSRDRGGTYMTAMRFQRIAEKDRDTIISFIFSEERRMLKGGGVAALR